MKDLVVANRAQYLGDVERLVSNQNHTAEHVPKTDERDGPQSIEWPLCPYVEHAKHEEQTDVDAGVQIGERAVDHPPVTEQRDCVEGGERKDPTHQRQDRAFHTRLIGYRVETMEEALTPDAVEEVPETSETVEETPPVTEPTKLIRIASMTRAMLDEARQAPLDEGGRKRLAEVHSRSVEELREILSPDLQEEFNEIMIPLNKADASESEVRVAQAQLIGWLEGLFHGIQASLWSQQMVAQNQLAEMQRRALGAPPRGGDEDATGLYL